MRNSLSNPLLFLSILCLGVMSMGIVLAEDQNDQQETYGAYPGAPTSVTGQPVATAYPAQAAAVVPAAVEQTSALQMQTGQVGSVSGGYATATSTPGTSNAVYYTQAPPAAQQNIMLSYDIQAAPPTAVYYSGSYVPWASFYQVFPANSPVIWASTFSGWSWYATCPLSSWIQQLIYVPNSGIMRLYELQPDGTTRLYNYGFAAPGYKYRWFYADGLGIHVSMVTISDNPSNYVTIDVA